ncbi:predicted protein [Arabidopsis lyrata subsp. lyrata]|uniref:Predicted protein n=1 Tax=Arabidopsis lyrata subsp. lyrata TaxID=81972 RepID=D7MJ99_ARALL|nr:predicted protein [Arabidopsis lyrata subsp. lyrata]
MPAKKNSLFCESFLFESLRRREKVIKLCLHRCFFHHILRLSLISPLRRRQQE